MIGQIYRICTEVIFSSFDNPNHKRHGLFVFVEPFEVEGTFEEYRKQFWDILAVFA